MKSDRGTGVLRRPTPKVECRWTSSNRRPINEIDNVADVLFVGHAFEGFFRESDQGTEALGELTVEFEAGGRIEFSPTGDCFQSEPSFVGGNAFS